MYGTDGYLHQCSLDRDHVCSAMIVEFCHCEWIDLEGERIPTSKCCFGSIRLSGMQNVWRNLYARSLFFCQIRNQFFFENVFFKDLDRK
jgi:hypothetical protein